MFGFGFEVNQGQVGYRRKYKGLANQEGNADEKEVPLAVDLYVCKATTKEEPLSLAGKLKISDEYLGVPDFKLKVVILDHIGEVLEKKNRAERVNFMKEIMVSLAKERDLPSLEGEGEMSEPSETRNRESHDRNTGDSMTFAGMGEDGINDGWCDLHNAGCIMQVAGHVLWPRAAWLYHGATFLMAISLIVSGGSTNIWCLALSSVTKPMSWVLQRETWKKIKHVLFVF